MFPELRDLNFALVGNTLNRIAKRINADYERRNEARTVKQIRDFVGKLAGLQNEHQALRLRQYTSFPLIFNLLMRVEQAYCLLMVDTGLSEQIMTTTTSDEFNVTLEIQQSVFSSLITEF